MSERVILAYSGGLDTSVAISWIGKETGREVVAVAIDLGQGGEDMEVVRQRALDCGAVEAVVVDARDEFANEYCLPTIKSNALYMDRYPLVSAISRPLIVKHLVTPPANTVAASSPTAARARATTRCASRSDSPRWHPISRCWRRFATTRGPARRRSRSPRRTPSRSTSPSARPSRSIRTYGAERWKPDSWNTFGTPPRRTSTTTPRTRRSIGVRPTRSSSGSPRAFRFRSTASPSPCWKPSSSSTGAREPRASAGSTWSRTGWSASRAARSTKRLVRWCSSPHTPNSSTSRWSANSAASSARPISVGASWCTTASGTRR